MRTRVFVVLVDDDWVGQVSIKERPEDGAIMVRGGWGVSVKELTGDDAAMIVEAVALGARESAKGGLS